MSALRQRKLLVLVLLALTLLVGAGVLAQAQTAARPQSRSLQANTAFCSGSFCIDWQVLAGGIGPMESDSYRLESTLGQTMAGSFAGEAFELEAGYWAGVNRGSRVFVPIIIR